MKKTKKDLKPFSPVIQICPECRKFDVYLDDGHRCNAEEQTARQESEDNFWK